MNFNDFSNIVSKIEKNPLPGIESHFKMTSAQRAKELETLPLEPKKPKSAAVLAAFYPDKQQQTHLLFIKRQGGNGVHANQIAFPGGKAELYDENLKATALREAFEEVGIKAQDISFIKSLTPVFIPPSNFLVQPYLGLYMKNSPFVAQNSEVHSLLEIPLNDILNENNNGFSKLSTSYTSDIEVPSFTFNNQIIWGATAMMLNEIRWLLREVL